MLQTTQAAIPFLLHGLLITIGYSALAIVFGTLLGGLLGFLRSLHIGWLDRAIGAYREAMAVKGERIMFLGTTAELLPLAGPNTKKLDLKGRTVIPGIVDSHTHLHNHAYSWWAQNNTAKYAHLAKRIAES